MRAPVHPRRGRALRVDGHVEVGQRVLAVRVAPVLGHEHLGAERAQHGRHDGVDRAQPAGAVGAARSATLTAVPSAPGPRGRSGDPSREERRAALVDGDGEDARVVPERVLHAVAVVGVEVDVRDALDAVVEQAPDRDGRVVVDAEARRRTRLRVVHAARDVHGVPGAARGDLARRLVRARDDPRGRLVHPGKTGSSSVPRPRAGSGCRARTPRARPRRRRARARARARRRARARAARPAGPRRRRAGRGRARAPSSGRAGPAPWGGPGRSRSRGARGSTRRRLRAPQPPRSGRATTSGRSWAWLTVTPDGAPRPTDRAPDRAGPPVRASRRAPVRRPGPRAGMMSRRRSGDMTGHRARGRVARVVREAPCRRA